MIISSLSHARGVLSEARFWHCVFEGRELRGCVLADDEAGVALVKARFSNYPEGAAWPLWVLRGRVQLFDDRATPDWREQLVSQEPLIVREPPTDPNYQYYATVGVEPCA